MTPRIRYRLVRDFDDLPLGEVWDMVCPVRDFYIVEPGKHPGTLVVRDGYGHHQRVTRKNWSRSKVGKAAGRRRLYRRAN